MLRPRHAAGQTKAYKLARERLSFTPIVEPDGDGKNYNSLDPETHCKLAPTACFLLLIAATLPDLTGITDSGVPGYDTSNEGTEAAINACDSLRNFIPTNMAK